MSLYVSEKVGNEIVLKKYAPAVPVYRGFWAIVIGGFAGTLVSCNGTSIRYIGSNEKTVYQIIEPGTYTFTATRHGETKSKTIVLDDKDPNNSYTVNLGLYIGMQYLEYIESTGTQYIDTSIIQSEYRQNLIIEMDVQFTEIPDSSWTRPKSYVGGCDENGNYFLPFCLQDNSKFSSNVGLGGTDIDPMTGDLNRHKVIVNTVNGTLKIDNQTFNYSSNVANIEKSIYLFIENSSGLNSIGKIRLYSCTFKDGNDNVIKDFAPIKDDTNHGAMYDKVTQQIFYNSGTGEFICGPNKPYTRIQYIEGTTCEQYIDTGIIPTSDMTYYGKFGFVEFISSQNILQLFGSRNASGIPNGIYASIRNTGTGLDFFDTSRYELSTSVTRNDVFDFAIDNHVSTIKKNGTVVGTHTFSTTTNTTNYTLHLNALITGGVVDNIKGTSRIYSFKVLNRGTLVRDMIPVLDNEGTPCMYDKVNDRLYYNNGIGEFIAGPEYIELEYIESTGTQWIDTGFHPDNLNTTRFMIMCQFTGGESGDWLVNGISSRQGTGFYVGMTDTTRNQFVYLYDATDVYTNVSIPNRFGLYTYDYNGLDRYVKITSGSSTLVNASLSTITPSTKPSIVIFGYNNRNEDGSPNPRSEKIYYCKIYSEGVLVHDFVPAKRSDNVLGMYDKITETFFTNAGTGEFIAGPEE